MEIIKCTPEDASVLAEMNRQLIEDEGSTNPMSIPQLKERMESFLQGNYEAYFFMEKGNRVGYALIDTSKNPLYLRQFLIRREYRRQHLGTAAFEALKELFKGKPIDLEVLTGNEAGAAFWESLGFREYSRYLRLKDD